MPHPPIQLTDEDGVTVGDGIVGGNGTEANPWLVAGWSIDLKLETVSAAGTTVVGASSAIQISNVRSWVLVEGNVLAGSPDATVLVVGSPHVRVEDNAITLDNAAHAGAFAPSGARPTGVWFQSSGGDVAGNDVVVANVSHAAATAVRVTTSAVDVEGNSIANRAWGLKLFEGVLVEGATPAVVDGNSIENDGGLVASFAGVRGSGCRATVTSNVVANPGGGGGADVGVDLEQCSFSTVASNVLRAGQVGLYAAGSGQNTLRGNQASSNLLGLVLQSETGDTLRSNALAGNAYGFGEFGAVASQFSNDVDRSNTVNGKPIVILSGLRDARVDASALGPYGFLGVVHATNVTVENVALAGSGQGLLLGDFNLGLARNLTVSGDWRGVDVSASYGSRVTLAKGTNAVEFGSSSVEVDNATFTGAGSAATRDPTTGAPISLGPYGVWLGPGTSHATFADVTSRSVGVGVFSQGATGSSFARLLVQSASWGAWAEGSSTWTARSSSFLANNVQVEAVGGSMADARSCWWGGASGPPAATIVTKSGGSVLVAPWLTSAPTPVGGP